MTSDQEIIEAITMIADCDSLPSNPVPITRTGLVDFYPLKSRPKRRTGYNPDGTRTPTFPQLRAVICIIYPSGRAWDGVDAVPLTNPVRPTLPIGGDGVGDWTGTESPNPMIRWRGSFKGRGNPCQGQQSDSGTESP